MLPIIGVIVSLGYDIKNLHIHFTLSIQSLQLKKGVTNVAVKNCAPDSPIGKFYMCYSKNLTDLEKLEVDAQHCCYCSSEASLDCMKLFPNWNLTDAGSSVFKCYLSLLTITDTDTGYYQCRLSLVETDNDYRNCMLRFGDITKLSVSNPTPSPSPVPNPSPRPADHHSNRNAGHWIHTHVAITCVIVGTIIAGIVAIILVILKVAHHVYMKPTRTSGGNMLDCMHADMAASYCSCLHCKLLLRVLFMRILVTLRWIRSFESRQHLQNINFIDLFSCKYHTQNAG